MKIIRNAPALGIWVIADTHFLHDNLMGYCGRPKDHTIKIFKNLMDIPEKDLLIHLGDISIGNEKRVYEEFIKRIKCRKILVKGNHDRKSNNWYLTHGWDFVCYTFKDEYRGKQVLFSHYPTYTYHVDYNLHGHLHNNVYKWDKLTKENKMFVNEKHLLLSCEATNYRPMKLDYILDKPDKFRLINSFKE